MTDIEIQKAFRVSKRVGLDTGKGLTEQAHKNETDMNYILRDYTKTGYIKHAKEHEGKYDDISVQDFQEAMFTVTAAQNLFNDLPAEIKKEFGQDPAQFLEFVQNPDNEGYMNSLGILKGNDGIDINGVAVKVPTKAHYDAVQRQKVIDEAKAEALRDAEAAQTATSGT